MGIAVVRCDRCALLQNAARKCASCGVKLPPVLDGRPGSRLILPKGYKKYPGEVGLVAWAVGLFVSSLVLAGALNGQSGVGSHYGGYLAVFGLLSSCIWGLMLHDRLTVPSGIRCTQVEQAQRRSAAVRSASTHLAADPVAALDCPSCGRNFGGPRGQSLTWNCASCQVPLAAVQCHRDGFVGVINTSWTGRWHHSGCVYMHAVKGGIVDGFLEGFTTPMKITGVWFSI